MGLSRDTFYRYKHAVEEGGIEALLEVNRRKPNPKNGVEARVEEAVIGHALDYPAHGQVRVSNELYKQGIVVSPSGVRSNWLRQGLANFKSRLKALEAKVAEEGLILDVLWSNANANPRGRQTNLEGKVRGLNLT